MPTAPVVAPPLAPPSGAPVLPGTTTPINRHTVRCSEALIVTCVLAELAGSGGCIRYVPADLVADLVTRGLTQRSHVEILEWRTRVPPTEWAVRWDCARRVAATVYPTLSGVADVPDVYAAFDGPTPRQPAL